VKTGDLRQELERTLAHAELRRERAGEILSQRRLTPVHWANLIPLSGRTTPRTLELMALATSFASFVVQQAKVLVNRPRPHLLSEHVQPLIATPPYSASPSGHACESALVGRLLAALIDAAQPNKANAKRREALRAKFEQLAQRIAENRVVAGIHYPLDSKEGVDLAKVLEEHMLAASDDPTQVFGWLWAQALKEWQ
jgi:hypothetical protein